MAVPDAHVLYGDALSAAGRYADAAEAYQKAGNRAFTEGSALRMVAAFGRAGNAASALNVLCLYITHNPLSIPAKSRAAKAYREKGQGDRAAAPIDRLLRRTGGADASWVEDLA